MAAMFKRASILIRESISVEGCVILDASGAVMDNIEEGPDTGEGDSSPGSAASEQRLKNEDETPAWNTVQGEIERDGKPTSFHPGAASQRPMCEVLGYSSKFDVHPADGQTTTDFPFSQDTFNRLLKRYPNGSILNFEQNGSVSSGEEEVSTHLRNGSTSHEGYFKSRNQVETQNFKEVDNQVIMDTIPGIRRLAFFPLWDTNTKTCICALLAWTNDPLRVLDADDDMAYLAAFGNSIMAEKARLDASMVDRMKSNFISTVSHELRSPLHGILASAELLTDMSASTAQMSVIRMINVCGQTLLDTINHILDFTELNRLRKSKLLDKKKPRDRYASRSRSQLPLNLLKQTANLDLSLLVEEVVESTLAGYDFSQSDSMVKPKAFTPLPPVELRSSSPSRHALGRANGNVKVILDIDWRKDWMFSLQPGAWRRIVMNLFGNAVKYTKEGSVCVSLKSIPNVSKQDNRPLVILTVSDTGKGISKSFLKHHVFKPFWQEDSLAPGTGLGLSIVQQIVRELGGHIEIKSKEGSGTKVTVQVPFALPAPTPTPALKHADDDDLQLAVRRKMNGLKAQIISSNISTEDGKEDASETAETDAASFSSVRNSLCKTLKHWFEMETIMDPSTDSADADVYLLLTDDLSTIGELNGDNGFVMNSEVSRIAEIKELVVLCTTQVSVSMKAATAQKAIHLVEQPYVLPFHVVKGIYAYTTI
jgi:signal transduction histidine kinase